LTFEQVDGSWTYLDEFVVMATWQNGNGKWRTWLYYTDDNFATGSWQPSFGDGHTGFDMEVDFDLVKGGETDEQDILIGRNYSNVDAGTIAIGPIKSIVRLTDTKSVVLYVDMDSTNPPHSYYCKVIDILGDGSLDIGPEHGPINYYDGSDWHFISKASVFAWSDTEFILVDVNLLNEDVTSVQDPWDIDKYNENSYYNSIRLCSVSGTTINFGTRYEFWTPSFPDRIATNFMVDKLPGSNDDGFFAYTILSTRIASDREKAFARVISKTGAGTLALRTEYQWETSSAVGARSISLIPFTDSIIAILYNTGTLAGDGPYALYTKTATIGAGFSLSFTSRVLLISVNELEDDIPGWQSTFDSDRLTDTKAIITYTDIFDYIYAATISRSGTALTVEDWQVVQYDYEFPPPAYSYINSGSTVSAISDSKWLIWMGLQVSPGPFPISLGGKIGYLTGTYSHEYGQLEYNLGAPLNQFGTHNAVYMSSEHVLIYVSDLIEFEPYRAAKITTGFVGSGYDSHGQGISIGKGAGDRVYMTAWNGRSLELHDYDLPALTLYDVYYLGDATNEQVTSGLRRAYPFSGYGNDNWVVVYGRMNDPYGLGNPTYVLESTTGGLTAILVPTDNTWHSGFCSALWMEADGFMYAIRDLGTASKLYYGNYIVYLNYMSDLSFPAGVNPKGLKLDPYTLAIYAAADRAQSIMIVKSHPFYSRWEDMTYDHGTTSPVKSLELL
jgi:hypothetical protein